MSDFVDAGLAGPPHKIELQRIRKELGKALQEKNFSHIARETVRYAERNGDLTDLYRLGIRYAAPRLENGFDYSMAGLAATHEIMVRFSGEKRVLPLVQGLACLAESCYRLPPRTRPGAALVKDYGSLAEMKISFARAVEEGKETEAESLLRGMLAAHAGREDLVVLLMQAINRHWRGNGHGLVDLIKAMQLIDTFGWSFAPDLLSALVLSIIREKRDDALSFMGKTIQRLGELEREIPDLWDACERGAGHLANPDPLIQVILDGTEEELLEALDLQVTRGVPFDILAECLALAAAERMIRFDPRYGDDWFCVTPLLTYANALRSAYRLCPDPSLLRSLFLGARFIQHHRQFDRRESPDLSEGRLRPLLKSLREAIRRHDVRETEHMMRMAELHAEWARFLLDECLQTDAGLDRMRGIKTTLAAVEEWERSQFPQHRSAFLIAAARYLAADKPHRSIAREVGEAFQRFRQDP